MADEWIEIHDLKALKQDVKELRGEVQELKKLLLEMKKDDCKDCAEIRSAYAKIRRGEVFPYFKKLSLATLQHESEK